jgi:hypothetical protein
MANRILRDWTDSDKINNLSVHAERFFTRLIMKVDDYGRFFSDPRLLKANLFPLLLDSIREADVTRWMAECQKAGLIVIYEIKGKGYLQIEVFKQTLRQKKERYPGPEKSATQLHSNSTSIAPPETETKQKLETKLEPQFFTKIGSETFNKKVSQVLDQEYRSMLEIHLMGKLKGLKEVDVLRTMDIEFANYHFEDVNHLNNALKGIGPKIKVVQVSTVKSVELK